MTPLGRLRVKHFYQDEEDHMEERTEFKHNIILYSVAFCYK